MTQNKEAGPWTKIDSFKKKQENIECNKVF